MTPATTTEPERPLCSVLTTAINHVMIPPTPLEADEFQEYYEQQQQQQQQQAKETTPSNRTTAPPVANTTRVPVIRIFGPIVRGDAPSGKDPVQSACLYIHGAFPYLLARPVLAGPDGSLHHSSHLSDHSETTTTSSGHLDWDRVEAVKRVAPIVHKRLEEMLQAASRGSNSQQLGNNTDSNNKETTASTKFIRKVSVVTGRGFYTFCPGPAAPFLRVEYYDPKVRWKVKKNLERGLDLPLMYHPDPQQYDAVAMAPSADSSQLGFDPLRFHCYEAHIPYTMQFYKDWNLAGMSYIHLKEGKFRPPLPSSVRRRWPDQGKSGVSMPDMEEEKQLAFLVDNTPLGSIWEKEIGDLARKGTNAKDGDRDFASASHSLSEAATNANANASTSDSPGGSPGVDMFWIKKETSCDIEIDVDVSSIMNVRAIMTALPEDKAEGENVHWRAVPSLREVWQEERRRMAKLLPPKDDFLSKQTLSSASNDKSDQGNEVKHTPPFTLSVKKDASTPGSRLAVKGMKRLMNLTYGLEEDFMRALRQIIQRHSAAVSQVDRQLKSPSSGGNTITRGADAQQSQLTPSNDEALDALGGLASQFDGTLVGSGSGALDSNFSASPGGESEKGEAFSSDDDCNGSNGKIPRSTKTFETLPQSDFNPQQGSQSQSTSNVLESNQPINRGQSTFDDAEGLINPETLEPYEILEEEESDIDEEDEMDEAALERVLTELATQIDEPDRGRTDPPLRSSGDSMDDEYDSDEESISDNNSLPSEGDATENLDDDNVAQSSEICLQLSDTPSDAPTQYAPSRASLRKASKRLLQKPPSLEQKVTPSWLTHSAAYKSFREKEGPKANHSWIPKIPQEGISIQPSKPPPCRDEVVFWYRRKMKRSLSTGDMSSGGKKTNSAVSANGRELASANLNVDGNSGQLVAATNSAASNEGVEEVHWEPSQSQCLSLSQGHPRGSQGGTSVDEFGGMTANFTAASLSGTQTQHKVAPGVYSTTPSDDSKGERRQPQALLGMQNQGGRLVVEGGGQLKAKTRPSQSYSLDAMGSKSKTRGNGETFDSRYLPTPFTMVSVEVHVQCRKGRASASNSTTIAMTADAEKDQIFAVCYVFGRDPGGGGALQFLERGCLYVQLEAEKAYIHDTPASYFDSMKSSIPEQIMGVSCPLSLQAVKDERQLLLRLASIIRWKDPDLMISWDTQGAGLGYIIERGANLGRQSPEETKGLDMVRLLGRLPATDKKVAAVEGGAKFFDRASSGQDSGQNDGNKRNSWEGSGLGSDWDEKVGAGSAAASIIGRLVFSGYKIIAEEVKHPNNSYLPAMVSTVLGKRIPHHDELMLTNWYAIKKGRERWRVLHHRLVQGTATLLLFDALDIVGRAGESARLSGVEFSQSFPGIRGSQYKVEGVLLRALKSLNSEERGSKRGKLKSTGGTDSGVLSEESISQTQSPWKKRRQSASGGAEQATECGYFFYSPSLQDTNKQEALEMQALNLEPQSGHHTDPVVVCDFTALYPSLIIAYNLCYSTCAGRLSYHTTRREMLREGRTTGRVGPFLYSESRTATVLKHHMKSLKEENNVERGTHEKDRAYAAPTGTIYVAETVVRGVLPQVLDELLSTRAMLKKAAKEYKRLVPNLAPSILRQLEARQLALKYVANVTYGYTSATFSGRSAMPLLADTIVDCGRRTLTNAINLANIWGREGSKWQNCEVLYGDTDSIFIKLPGRSVEEAFDFGEQFCRAVTSENPPPVQLKLEKVYIGSILQTKKKYLGMKLESRDAKSPEFEAKGIETVRKDQCQLTQKILRNSLITLFRHGLNAVKNYLFRQWSLILSGRVPIADFIITGRVRSKYRGGKPGPVQAALFRRLNEADPGRVIRNKERLAYVIVATPGVNIRLRESVVTPMELLEQWDAYTIHTTYYITKHVNAALQRCFGLAPHHVKISDWYAECPKPRRRIHFWPLSAKKTGNSSMISQYFGSDICSLCGIKCMAEGRARAVVCSSCRKNDVNSLLVATRKLQTAQSKAHELAKRCSACNLCFEDGSTFAALVKDDGGNESDGRQQKDILSIPLAACTCTDCPTTYERHRLREETLEADAICKALGL